MAKLSKTYRLPEDTLTKIDKLKEVFSESSSEVIERAVNFLDRERALEVKHEHDLRISKK